MVSSAASTSLNRKRKALTKVVGIGASAGGLEAFTSLLRSLPTEANVAYVLVQHLDPTHRSLLSELLAKTTTLPVKEIEQNSRVAPNQVYVIPPNCDLAISNGILKLTTRKRTAGAARSIDHFFKSLAADQKENAIGVILSGAGSDGAEGLRAIKEAGGVTFAQDDTAKYDSMPRSAIATGCVDFVLPPVQIASEITRILDKPDRTKLRAAANAKTRGGKVGSRTRSFNGDTTESGDWPSAPKDAYLRKIFGILRAKAGVDFSFYRGNTIRRRLSRRLSINKTGNLERYLRILRENPTEVDALYQDLLINVTSFFRNPKVFEILKKKVFPKLVKNSGRDSLRVWVAGCSTGQEPYSLAMAYTEFAQEADIRTPIQIFASDVNPSVLLIARAGKYPKTHVETVSAKRLEQFFVRENDDYRVHKSIRDMVIFAQQNVITDPPFTRVDLISCRNMLIYLEGALQQRVIPSFHYALRPNGCLVLGSSESVGQFGNLFEPVEKTQKIYWKKPAATWSRGQRSVNLPAPKADSRTVPALRAPEFNILDALKEADRITVAKYGPVSVLINEDCDILQFRGDARRYLNLPTGKATFQLLRLAREGLVLPLQRAITRAKKEGKSVRERDVRFNGREELVTIEVVPLKNQAIRCFLILFEKQPPQAKQRLLTVAGGAGEMSISKSELKRYGELKHEFNETRERLQNLQEQHETSIEELQAANEEVQSANEELQSLNEELETSNEELESSNEELTTLNEELAVRNNELQESERKLREQGQMLELAPVLARSPKDRVLFWNRGAERLYGFTKEEAIGQNSHLLLASQYAQPLEAITKHLYATGGWEGEVYQRRKDGKVLCVATQWVVHYDEQKKIRGILQTDTDITARKEAEKALRTSEEFNRGVLESSPDCINVLDLDGRVQYWSPAAYKLMEITRPEEYADCHLSSFWEGDARLELEAALRQARSGKMARFQGICQTVAGKRKWWDVALRPMLDAHGRPERVLAVSRDITEQKQAELAASERARLAALRAEIVYAIALGNDLETTLQQVTERLATNLPGVSARIWVLDPRSTSLVLAGSAGRFSKSEESSRRIPLGETVVGKIAETQKPYVCPDLADEAAFPEIADAAEGLTSFVGLPLAIRGTAVGVLCIYSSTTVDERVLGEVSQSADAIAQFIHRTHVEIDRKRLFDEALAARNQVEILNDVGRMIAAELDLQRLTQAVAEAATKLTNAEFGAFFYNVLDDRGESYSLYTLAGAARETFSKLGLPRKTAAVSPPVDGAAVVRSGNIKTDSRFQETPLKFGIPVDHLPIQSYLAAPVVSRSGDVLGGLFFGHSKRDAFSEKEEKIVVSLAAQASVAMDNARLFDGLERKVSERTAKLQETISELQAFSYTVSHDLRAPLRAMQSYAQVLQQDCAERLDPVGNEYLARIVSAGARLDRLIQDVLTYSRISRAEVSLQPLELEKLVRDIIEQYPMLQAPAGSVVIEEALPQVLAEESSTTQCFSNLLGNAVKFIPDGRVPEVRISSEEFPTTVRIWIKDNGIGIPPEHHERIFKMFERVDSSKKYDGTGIGLAIVRRAMERMGGRVGVESTVGQGSQFWLEFRKPT